MLFKRYSYIYSYFPLGHSFSIEYIGTNFTLASRSQQQFHLQIVIDTHAQHQNLRLALPRHPLQLEIEIQIKTFVFEIHIHT